MPAQLTHRGAVLKRWRDANHLTQAAIGRAVPTPVGESAVSQWELGRRMSGLRQPQIDAIDTRFDAGGCFTDMCAAVGTPAGLAPDFDWLHNFQGPSGPCWGWARTSALTTVAAWVDAGPFRLEFDVPPGDGVIVQAHAFTTNPAVHVRLSEPGWVDFGRGLVPEGLALPIVQAIDFAIMGPGADTDPALSVAANLILKDRYGVGPGWFEVFKHRVGHRVEVARRFLTRTARASVASASDLTTARSALDQHETAWSANSYAALREARGLSQVDAAGLASDLDADLPPVSDDHVSRLEAGRTPRVPQLRERLDMVYRADGRTCVAPVGVRASGECRFAADFPIYWIGPVWVRYTPPPNMLRTPIVLGRLVWSPWRKTLRLDHDVVVTCRRSNKGQTSLVIEAPPNWTISAGVGVHPCAVDVNEGWGFVDVASAKIALAEYFDVLTSAMQGSRDGA